MTFPSATRLLLRAFVVLTVAASFGHAAAAPVEAMVNGGVVHPGRYSAAGDKGVIALIVAAGGLAANGCTEVKVLSTNAGKRRTYTINLWEIMAEFQPDWATQPGDIIVVPEHTVACLRDPKRLTELMADYLKARAASSQAPNDWKAKVAANRGGCGQIAYDGAAATARALQEPKNGSHN